jgi:hypothetical protein
MVMGLSVSRPRPGNLGSTPFLPKLSGLTERVDMFDKARKRVDTAFVQPVKNAMTIAIMACFLALAAIMLAMSGMH